MFELVTKNVPFPKPYPGVTRKPPTVTDKGWDKVGGYTLREKVDYMPQAGMQERVVACQSNLIFLCGESQMGKAQPYDAKVLTPDGFVRMGDIKVGDVICGSNGGTQRVLRIYEQGEKDVVRFTMRDGSSAESSLDHLWKIDCTVIQGKHISGLYTTSEIVDMFNSRSRRKGSIRNICFPICGPVDLNPKKELKIEPYLLGILLGDGHLGTNYAIRICNPNTEIIDMARSMGYECWLPPSAKLDYRIRGKNLRENLSEMGLLGKLSYEKFIPEEYLYASREERMELLRGLLDTDGSSDMQHGGIEYSTSSERLAKDVKFLVNSLGYVCKMRSRTTHFTYKGERKAGRTSYRIYIYYDENGADFFKAPSRKKNCKEHRERRSLRLLHYLESVENVGKKNCRCLLVSNDDHLYITDDFLVTHNTYSMFLKALNGVGKQGYTGRFISVRLQDSKKGSSIFRDAVEVMGNFGGCQYSSADYPTFNWPQWNNSVQLIHSNFNVENPSEWDDFKDYAKKNQASYIGIDEATEMKSFKMFSYWFSRNRDSSGMTPCMVMSFNFEHEHFTTTMLKDAGYIGDDWYFRPEMNGVTRYFYIKGDSEHDIIWGDTPEEVAERANISITKKEKEAGVTINQIVKSFTAFTGESADNLKLIAATKGQNIGNLHNTGATQRAILKCGYAGPVDNEIVEVSRNMVHQLWENPWDGDENMYALMDVSGGDTESDDCPMAILRGNQCIAFKFFRGSPKELVDFIDRTLDEYDVPVDHFAFDATGIGYYLKSYTSGFPVTANRKPIQEIDANGNPVTVEMYFNLRSQLLGKMKVMFEKGELSMAIDKNMVIPYGKKGRTRKLLDVLFDEINVFISTTRNKKIYYRSKDEYKAKFHSSPNLMDTLCLFSVFRLDARPKKQPEPEIEDDAYYGLYNTPTLNGYYIP